MITSNLLTYMADTVLLYHFQKRIVDIVWHMNLIADPGKREGHKLYKIVHNVTLGGHVIIYAKASLNTLFFFSHLLFYSQILKHLKFGQQNIGPQKNCYYF